MITEKLPISVLDRYVLTGDNHAYSKVRILATSYAHFFLDPFAESFGTKTV